MLWRELFSWANQNERVLLIQDPQTIIESILIIKSSINNIHGDSTLSIIDQSLYISVDYCTFFGCTSIEAYHKAGCIHTNLLNYGSVSITRTIAASCASSYEGNFGFLKVSEFGSIYFMMTSIDRCAPDNSVDNYHSIAMSSGIQTVKNINNTRGFVVRHSGFSNIDTLSAQIDFCNIVDNVAKQTCVHLFTKNGHVRRVNYIRNTLGDLYSQIEGLIGCINQETGTHVIMSDCVLSGNTATYLISARGVDVTLIGCYLDSTSFLTDKAHVVNAEPRFRQPITMTLMAGAGKHADIPYGMRTHMDLIKHHTISVLMMVLNYSF